MSSDKIWKFINREQVYDGSPYIKIFKDTVELPAGKIIDDYHRIEVNNAVMLLIENENKLKLNLGNDTLIFFENFLFSFS